VAEAGIEEALTQLNTSQLPANGWALESDGFHRKTINLTQGGTYDTGIRVDPTNPRRATIISTGAIPDPYNHSRIKRRILVQVQRRGFAPAGINAKGKISFNGTSVLDSFDSSDPAYSTDGRYDPAKRKANGFALTNSREADAIHVGTAQIFGAAATGPGGTVTTQNGSVGDANWNATQSGVQPGHARDDANIQFFDVQPPFVWGTAATPLSGTVQGTNYNYVLGTGRYNLPGGVRLVGGKAMVVTGQAVLYINGDFDIEGNGLIYIAPGASLELYLAGTGKLGGNGILNATGYAMNLSIKGLNSCQSLSYSGTSQLIGTVNAPHADFEFAGTTDAVGAFLARTVSIGGNAGVHYDERLSSEGIFAATSWIEIAAN
jgi:hypothetical protein